MDYTGNMIPGFDPPPLITLEDESLFASHSQHDYLPPQFRHSNTNGEVYPTYLPSPVYSEQASGFQHWQSHDMLDTEPRQLTPAQSLEVDLSKANARNTRKDYTCSSTASNGPQEAAHTDLGNKFEQILDVVEHAGFDSIDTMAAQYYSAEFEANSTSQLAQANSRSRDLRRLLQTLQKTAKAWSRQEKQAYQEEIVRSANSICQDELHAFQERQANRPCRPSVSCTASSTCSSDSNTGKGLDRSSAGMADQLLLKEQTRQPTQQEKRLLRQCMPETWSLLSGLAQVSELPPADVSQIVYSFMHVVTANTPG